MFLKTYTGLSDRKLIKQLNANYEYQYFCDIEILPESRIRNYEIVNEVRVEISKKTKLLWIFFGIHTGNAVEIGKRIKKPKNRFIGLDKMFQIKC